MKKLVFLLIIFLFCNGCEKDTSTNYSSSLIGKWSWLVSCGGFAGCSTPESTHTTMNLVFTVDSIYNVYQHDSLIVSSRFHVYKLISTDTKDTLNVLSYDQESRTFSVKNDTLRMNSLGIFNSTFKRIR
jgi:hypothetical protein